MLINDITYKNLYSFSDLQPLIQTATNRSIRIRLIEKYPSIFERELITYHCEPTKAHAGLVRSRWYVFFITSARLYFRERTGVRSRRKSRKLPSVSLHQAFYSNFMHPYYGIVYFSHWLPSPRCVKLRQGRPHTSAKQRPGRCPQRRSRACEVNTKIGLPISKEQKNSI